MKIAFPYQQWGDVSLPLVPVHLAAAGTFYAIVDSGANISLFQYEIAELLGLPVRRGERIPLAGIGGKIYGYRHQLSLTIAGQTFPCDVCFSKELRVPLNLLGRQDFFSRFRITFDEARRRTILEQY